MPPTDVSDPRYYHRVVDCQWACPAHTNVPEYIRLIAQDRFTDAYMLNRESNVFPGILGRTCDRPCEPACRRTRAGGEERKEGGSDRSGSGVTDRGERPDAARVPVHDLREGPAPWRADAHQ